MLGNWQLEGGLPLPGGGGGGEGEGEGEGEGLRMNIYLSIQFGVCEIFMR